ncbi:mono/diheme cytochrome c family protein [Albidovulum inexpectatum]|uniref:Mono/diheme cytochrome c family protein n=1 Tax=Albidovulum inexpectatum TaxID=196587 RepID=A0A2S5JI92_9RHOB|nr:mono/diheme cytochrome c family protein [Albidovulum inexpectatum]
MALKRRIIWLAAGLGGLAMAAWILLAPQPLSQDAMAGLTGDPVRGEQVFWAAGCAGCHADFDAKGDEKLILRGGQRFASPFGTFVAPNISPHPQAGIGSWSALDLANAMKRGVSPEGEHYYPAFPYASYARADLQDIADLHAFLMTLPPDPTPSQPHEVGFPFNIRAALGGWKLLFLTDDWVVTGDLTEQEARGRYLVEALGHCGECHTPRNALGGMQLNLWLAGAPSPDGKGRIPNITPGALDWSQADIVEYLTSGFTPDYDSAGGHMALVVQNTAHLPESDRAAIAAYLKRVPPVAERP